MTDELKESLWGPRWFLLGIIFLIGLFGLIFLGGLNNHLDAAIPIFIIVLVPFMIPFILSFFCPVVAGGILILEVLLPILYFVIFHGINIFELSKNDVKIILLGAIVLSIPIALGIWMIVVCYKKPKKEEEQEEQENSNNL